MKKHYLLGACMFAAMLTACTDEDRALSGVREGILTATVESNSVSSRVGFTTSNGKFYWSKGDRLGVTTSQSNTLFTPLNIAESGIGQTSASFSGRVSGTVEGYAVYPHNDNHAMSGTTLTYQFPSEYTYETLDADFTTATQGHGNSFNPPMWGEINNGSVALKHLGGVFCIKIDKLPVGNDLKMTLTSDKKLNGAYTVNLAASDNTPEITVTEASVETEKTVSVHFTNNATDATGVFYVPAPVGTHTLRLKVWNGTSEELNTALGTVTIARKALKVFSLSDGVLNAGAAAVQPWDGTSMQEPMMVNGVYTVETPAQWAWLTQHNTQGADIKLLNDLDFGNKEIGAMMLLGNFDGNNKTMSNMTVSINKTLNGAQGQTAIGLFKEVAKSVTAKNLTIKNIKIDNNLSTHYTGSLLGEANFNPNVVLTIDGVTVENADLKGVNGVGGLIGMVGVGKEVSVSNVAVKNSTLQNYSVEKESGFVGGLVGRVQNSLVIGKNVTLSDNKIVGYYAGEKENRPESCIDAVAAIRKGTSGKITGDATVSGGTVVAYPVGAILIGNAKELLAFAAEANKQTTGQPYQNQTVILTADIDLNGAVWDPLCNSGGADFYGTFDGNGKTISNFKVNHCNSSNSAEGAGFIGWLGSTGTVKDLTIDKAEIKGSHNVGGIVGYIQGGKVENCTVKNSSISCLFNTSLSDDGDKCGGIAGYLHNTSITGCSVVDTAIDAVRDAGQILGCKAVGTVDDKTNTATNVSVTYNNSDNGKAKNSNTNINKALVGRTL